MVEGISQLWQIHTTSGSQVRCTALHCCSYTKTDTREQYSRSTIARCKHMVLSYLQFEAEPLRNQSSILPETISSQRKKKLTENVLDAKLKFNNRHTITPIALYVSEKEIKHLYHLYHYFQKLHFTQPTKHSIYDQKQSKILRYGSFLLNTNTKDTLQVLIAILNMQFTFPIKIISISIKVRTIQKSIHLKMASRCTIFQFTADKQKDN